MGNPPPPIGQHMRKNGLGCGAMHVSLFAPVSANGWFRRFYGAGLALYIHRSRLLLKDGVPWGAMGRMGGGGRVLGLSVLKCTPKRPWRRGPELGRFSNGKLPCRSGPGPKTDPPLGGCACFGQAPRDRHSCTGTPKHEAPPHPGLWNRSLHRTCTLVSSSPLTPDLSGPAILHRGSILLHGRLPCPSASLSVKFLPPSFSFSFSFSFSHLSRSFLPFLSVLSFLHLLPFWTLFKPICQFFIC